MEEYLSDISSWFVKQSPDVLIVVGHGIKTNPQIIHAVDPKLESDVSAQFCLDYLAAAGRRNVPISCKVLNTSFAQNP